jgi:NADPH-dependent glutamate synthase beta subunit-like oxidoreductase
VVEVAHQIELRKLKADPSNIKLLLAIVFGDISSKYRNVALDLMFQELEMTNPRVGVLGTGANGATIAADLARAGHDVVLIDQWPAHVEAMRAKGVAQVMRE